MKGGEEYIGVCLTITHTLLLFLGCMVSKSILKPTGSSNRLHPEVGQPTRDPAHRNSHTNEHCLIIRVAHAYILVCSAVPLPET